MKKHGIEIATTDVLGNKIEPKLLVGDFNGYGSGEIFDANAVHLLVLQQIADLVNLAPEALDTLGEIADVLNLKEDAIADLEEIRSGAALGATSYQKPLSGIPYSDMAEAVLLLLDKAGTALQSHQDISHKVDRNELEEVAFTGSYQSLSNKPFIPTLVSQLANDAGYLTLHQDISMKADRSELFSREYDDLLNKPVIPVVPENVGDFVNNVGYLTQHQDISGKQDVIADLETIRAGAALGATSIQQHLSLANYYTKGEVDTILTTIEGEIPTKLSLLQNDPGYLTTHLSLADYLRIADLPLNLSSYTNDVPFLTQHLDISGKADKSTTVTNVAYDTTNKKFTKTINGSTTDIVNASTVVSGGITVVNNTPTLDWNTTSTIGSVQGTELKVKLPANPNTDTNTAALKVSDTTNKKINTVESPNSYILFEGGTNEFTVKDGVNSFKVSVTPSITNNVTGSSLTANNILLGNGNSTVKDSGKAIESGSNTTLSANDAKIPTSLVVKNYIDTSLTSVLRYKGTIGSSGATVTALPATHYVGWVYVVATAGTYAGKACEVGDYVICRIDGTTANDAHWDVVNGENLVSSANNTAAWGSAVIVGNVDGTDLKFTMPANPNTWRGILNNLTSTSTSDSLSAYQGYLLANGSARDNTKLPLTGGTLTGKLTVKAPIFGYNYNANGNNVASYIFDKPGSNYTGFGAHATADTIWFGACDSDGAWVDTYKQIWDFNGTIKQEGNAVIHAGNIGSQSVSSATSATQLQTSRSLWGNSFNGTADIDGTITMTGSGWKSIEITRTNLGNFSIGGVDSSGAYFGHTKDNVTDYFYLKAGSGLSASCNVNVYNKHLFVEGSSTGSSTISSDLDSIIISPKQSRTATIGTYYSGIAFNHLYRHPVATDYTVSSHAWIGTRITATVGSESDALVFATKEGTTNTDRPVERMCILPDGKVGIGTTSPSQKLDVNGTAKATGFKSSLICIECNNDGTTTGRRSEINNYSSPLYLQHNSDKACIIGGGGGNVSIGSGSAQTNKLHVTGDIFATTGVIGGGSSGVIVGGKYDGTYTEAYDNIERLGNGGKLYIQYYNSGDLNICQGGGKVGIGVTSPDCRLHVADRMKVVGGNNGNSNDKWIFKVVQGTDNGSGPYDTVIFSSNDVCSLRISESDNTQIGFCGGDSHGTITSTHDFRFYTGCTVNAQIYSGASGTLGMLIDSSGNVGVNTSAPTSKFHVNGEIRANNLLIGTGTSGRVIDTYNSGGKLLLQYGSSGDISMCYGGGYVGINNNNPEVELDVNGDMFIGGYGYIEQLAVGFKSHTQQEAINAEDGNIHMFTVSSWSGNLTVNNPIAGLIITVIFKNTNATTGFGVSLGNFAKSEVVSVTANGGVSIVQLVCTDSTQGSIYPASVKQYS